MDGHANAWENVDPHGPQDWTGRAPKRLDIAGMGAAVDSGGGDYGRRQLCVYLGSGS